MGIQREIYASSWTDGKRAAGLMSGSKVPSPTDDNATGTDSPTAAFDIPVKIGFGDPQMAKIDGRICRVNSGFVVLSSPIWFDRGHHLEISYAERCISAEVVYCNKESDRSFRLGLAMRDGNYGTFRTEQRIRVMMPATITIAGRNTPIPAMVLDISSSGVGFTTPQPLAIGDLVCVNLGTGLTFGEIRHCQKGLSAHHVGLQIDECLFCDPPEPQRASWLFKIAHSLFAKGTKLLR